MSKCEDAKEAAKKNKIVVTVFVFVCEMNLESENHTSEANIRKKLHMRSYFPRTDYLLGGHESYELFQNLCVVEISSELS